MHYVLLIWLFTTLTVAQKFAMAFAIVSYVQSSSQCYDASRPMFRSYDR